MLIQVFERLNKGNPIFMKQLTWKQSLLGEAYIDEVNNIVFEQHRSESIFERYLPNDFNKKHFITIVAGSDSGLLLPYLQVLADELQSYFMCVELPEVVEVIKKQGWQDSDRVRLVDESFSLTTLSTDNQFGGFFLRQAIQVLPSIAVIDKHPAYFSLWEETRQRFTAATIAFNPAHSAQFIDRHLTNMTELVYPFSRLENTLSGKTAVLLGGGPSVSLVLDWVKTHREALVVFAANRLSARLAKEGIAPDFFVAVDPQPALLDYCKEMFAFADRSILLCASAGSSNVLLQWSGRLVYADEATPFDDYVTEEDQPLNLTTTGPTVMNFALQSAWYMGCRSMIMAGVDLCYSPEGHSHESSSLEAQLGQFLKAGGAKVKTYLGDMANTDPQMALALETLQKQVNYYLTITPQLCLYQVNPNAAYVEKIELSSPDHLPIPSTSAREAMALVGQQLNWQAETAVAWLTHLQQQIDQRLEWYARLLKPISSVLARVRILAQLSPEELVRVSKQINRVKNRFETSLGDERFLLFDYAYGDYVKVLAPMEASDEAQSLEQMQQVLTHFFKAAYHSLLTLSTRLKEVAQRIQLRLRECHGELDSAMLAQWLAWNEPGRGQVWQAHNTQVVLTDSQAQLLQTAEQAFVELLLNKAPSFKDKFTDKHFRMTSLWQQVEGAIQTNDAPRLTTLADYLISQTDDESMSQLGHYASMATDALAQNWHGLLQQADSIQLERLLLPKHKLLTQAYLALGELDKALVSLEVMCRFSADYFIAYAELAGLMQLNDVAEFAYRLAVKTHTEDVLTRQKAQLWAEKQQRDSLLHWLAELT